MTSSRPPKKTERRSRRQDPPANLTEEIERIQNLLRRQDEDLAGRKEEIPLKELAQAVHAAVAGGRSIAQLRKFALDLENMSEDEDTQSLRASLLTVLERLGKRRDSAPAGSKAPTEPGADGA